MRERRLQPTAARPDPRSNRAGSAGQMSLDGAARSAGGSNALLRSPIPHHRDHRGRTGICGPCNRGRGHCQSPVHSLPHRRDSHVRPGAPKHRVTRQRLGQHPMARAPRRRGRREIRLWGLLGAGLIAGASDDDPSGIGTYSQAGATFGYALGWTLLFSYPLMVAIQGICARIGRTSGRGLAGNLREHYPNWVLHTTVALLFIANTLNIGADLGAMAAATRLLLPQTPGWMWITLFGVVCTVPQIILNHRRYVGVLKWLTLALFSYFASLLQERREVGKQRQRQPLQHADITAMIENDLRDRTQYSEKHDPHPTGGLRKQQTSRGG